MHVMNLGMDSIIYLHVPSVTVSGGAQGGRVNLLCRTKDP